jgi:ketopantoate reductase
MIPSINLKHLSLNCCFAKYYRAADRKLSEISADESARSASADVFTAVVGILAARSFESPR